MTNPKPTSLLLGLQWGDEGKGKLVDILSTNIDVICRCAGGNNAGHTLSLEGKVYKFHLLPSGLLHNNTIGLIGNGCVIHLPSLLKEIEDLEAQGVEIKSRLKISDRAHLVFDCHQIVDGLKEVELGRGNIGTTRKGIGPCYSTKASRSGVRLHHLMGSENEFAERYSSLVNNRMKRYGEFEYDIEAEIKRYAKLKTIFQPMVCDTVEYLYDNPNKRVLIEGANATMLDIDLGTYPFVTSSNCTVGGAITGLGIPPKRLGTIYGVVKAYTTRVGSGPFPTEQLNSIGEHLINVGHEYGTTTGRPRRCGWLDLVLVKYACAINGVDTINLTKLDVLDKMTEIKIATEYTLNGKNIKMFPASLDDLANVVVTYVTLPGWNSDISKCNSFANLPVNAQKYVEFVESYLDTPISYIGVGPDRTAMILK